MIDKFAEEQKENSMAKKRQESDEFAALRAELAVTKRAYEDERVKLLAYEVMIELAGAELQI